MPPRRTHVRQPMPATQASVGGPAPDRRPGPVALSPEVKQAIAEEVKAQLAVRSPRLAGSGASSGVRPARLWLRPTTATRYRRRWIRRGGRSWSHSDGSVVADGQECSLTSGDVITRLTDTPDSDGNVNASVSASKQTDCARGQAGCGLGRRPAGDAESLPGATHRGHGRTGEEAGNRWSAQGSGHKHEAVGCTASTGGYHGGKDSARPTAGGRPDRDAGQAGSRGIPAALGRTLVKRRVHRSSIHQAEGASDDAPSAMEWRDIPRHSALAVPRTTCSGHRSESNFGKS